MDQSLSECQSSIQQLKVDLHSFLQLSISCNTVSQHHSDSTVTINLCVEDHPDATPLPRNLVYQISRDLLEVERSFAQIQNSINSFSIQSIPLEESLSLLHESLGGIKTQLTIISERTKVHFLKS